MSSRAGLALNIGFVIQFFLSGSTEQINLVDLIRHNSA